MRRILNGQKGAVIITFAILLTVLLGFVALGMEVGRWYLVRAELSKGVDAAAFSGAINISNPAFPEWGDKQTFMQQIGKENFPNTGYLGTESGSVIFTATTMGTPNTVKVTGKANALAILARLFGINLVPVSSTGAARINKVEIMMVLDESYSMRETPWANLQIAANSFVTFFKDTEAKDQDKIGLVTFATGVKFNFKLGHYFYTGANNIPYQINNTWPAGPSDPVPPILAPGTETNAEDALARSGNEAAGGFTEHPDPSVRQFLIFFTDGNPNAFTGMFTRDGTPRSAVTYALGPNGSCSINIADYLYNPDDGSYLKDGSGLDIPALPTGDGLAPATTKCTTLSTLSALCTPNLTTKWDVFNEFPAPDGHGPEDCDITNYCSEISRNDDPLKPDWFRNTARQMAIDHATTLKDNHVKIYTIGLCKSPTDCTNVDEGFLRAIASGINGEGFYYPAPTPADLNSIFIKVAKQIRLQLVE